MRQNKHYPNTLGSLAAEKRETSTRMARLIQARVKAESARHELQPLVKQQMEQKGPIALAWAHLLDAESLLAKAIDEESIQ